MIYPITKKHYCGGYNSRKNSNKWTVSIRSNGVRYSRGGFRNEQEALEHLKQKNIEFKLPIKNLIHDMGDYYEVELTQGKRTKFDKDDLNLIQRYVINCAKSGKTYYARRVNIQTNRMEMLHNIIMRHTPSIELTVDHINNDGLDNRRVNLRIANRKQQMTNRRIQSNNTSGVVGVKKEFTRRGEKVYFIWRCKWNDVNGKEKSKSFSTNKHGDAAAKQMAENYRKQIIVNLPHYN